MTNCHDDLLEFYKQKVKLPKDDRDTLDTARNTCKDAVIKGLKEKEDLAPERFVEQGSFGMWTVVQHKDDEYDIDYGILFEKDKIVGSRGGDKSPRAARQMIADSFVDKRFKEKPELKKNCVRFHYQDGYHVDMPVYRRYKNWLGQTVWEIASGDEWKASDPEAVTKWFNGAVKDKSPDMKSDGQMRRIVCLLKAVEKTREYFNWPSGFIISVLVNENYVKDERDDVSFVKTVRRIVSRLESYQTVRHPVVSEKLADEGDSKVIWMRDKLKEFDAKFKTLEQECARGAAMRIWDQIFGSDNWFGERLAEKAASIGFAGIASSSTSSFTRPPDANRWG